MNNNEKNCKETILIQNEIDGTLLTSTNQTGSNKKGRNKSNLADQVALIDLKTKNQTPSKQASTIKNKPNHNNNNKKSNLKSEEDASLFKNNNTKIVENKDLESSSLHDIKNDDQSKLNVAEKIKNKIYSAKKLDLKSNETQSILSDNSKQLPKLINSSNNQVFYLNNVPQTSTSQQQQQQQQHQQFLETQNEIYNKKIVTSTEYKESDEMFKHYNLSQSSLISPNSKFKSTSSINLSTKCKLFIKKLKYFYFSLKF